MMQLLKNIITGFRDFIQINNRKAKYEFYV